MIHIALWFILLFLLSFAQVHALYSHHVIILWRVQLKTKILVGILDVDHIHILLLEGSVLGTICCLFRTWFCLRASAVQQPLELTWLTLQKCLKGLFIWFILFYIVCDNLPLMFAVGGYHSIMLINRNILRIWKSGWALRRLRGLIIYFGHQFLYLSIVLNDFIVYQLV